MEKTTKKNEKLIKVLQILSALFMLSMVVTMLVLMKKFNINIDNAAEFATYIKGGTFTVGLIIIDLWSHVLIGTGFCTTHGLFHSLGNSKIAQFIFAFIGYENILRFDISMDDILLATQFQGRTHILRHLDYHIIRNRIRHCFRQDAPHRCWLRR